MSRHVEDRDVPAADSQRQLPGVRAATGQGPSAPRPPAPNSNLYTSSRFKRSPDKQTLSQLGPACFPYPEKWYPTYFSHR